MAPAMSDTLAHHRPFKRLLVCNRGEIAVRIINAARELPTPVQVFALYTPDDQSHCQVGKPHRALQIPSASSYLDIPFLVNLVREHSIDAVHPGYGFLSESAEFSRRMWEDAGAVVIGPGCETLARTGDKLQAKQLAQECMVPILQAMDQSTFNLDQARAFCSRVGFPVMVKAVDGGGGRGIRLVRADEDLDSSLELAMRESPSKQVFLEKAAVDGFHHVEVQIIGDGTGQVRHLWERDCSAQRRFQKVVEFAPSLMKRRGLVSKVIESALRMARHIRYRSLGTFEFLVNEQEDVFYFLEANPRLQVEHTITESITGVDLVQTQLLLAQGYTFAELGLGTDTAASSPPPASFSIQLRLCAEDPSSDFALSIGKVTEFTVPSGHGTRVDTHVDMHGSRPVVVGSNFDNLLAKIIVTASTWKAAVHKARRVLDDTLMKGVQTNLNILRGIVSHPAFMNGEVDTQWLGLNLPTVIQHGKELEKVVQSRHESSDSHSPLEQTGALLSSNVLFRKGNSWNIMLGPSSNDQSRQAQSTSQHIRLSRVLRNEFPTLLEAEIEYSTQDSRTPISRRMRLEATDRPALLDGSSRRQGDPRNAEHVILPMSGKLIEILVEEGDEVAEGQGLAFIQQMKMEIEIRSPRAGKVKWVYGLEDGEDVEKGMLLVELALIDSAVRGKL